MGKLVFGMMQSLDGCVAGAPGSDGYVAAGLLHYSETFKATRLAS